MPFDGSGNFVAPTVTGYPAVAGQKIRASTFNNVLQDVFDGLGDCMTRAGEAAATANIPFGGFKATGLGDGAATGDALAYGQATAAYLQKILTGAGAVGAPAIYPTGDTNTGRWYPAADTVAESVGGAELLRWSTTGFGVGVTPGVKFHVKGVGGVVKLETTTVRGSGANYISWADPTGEKGFAAYGAATDVFYLWNRMNANMLFGVNDALAATLGVGGNFTTVGALAAGSSVTATTSLNGATLATTGDAAVGGNASVTGNLTLTGMGGNVKSGTYDPTLTAVANCTGPTGTGWSYIRVGSYVTVWGVVNVTSSGAGAFSFRATLPIASDLTSNGALPQLQGSATDSTDFKAVYVNNDNTNDAALFNGSAVGAAARALYFTFGYFIR